MTTIKLIAILVFCVVWAIVINLNEMEAGGCPEWNIPDFLAYPLYFLANSFFPILLALIMFLLFF